MPVETEADLAAFFNPDEFGVAATYTPPGGGAATACTVLLDEADRDRPEFAGRPHMAGRIVTVLRSELAAPARGGRFTIGAAVYSIVGEPSLEQPAGTIWTCMVG